jgi:hypothetical protein
MSEHDQHVDASNPVPSEITEDVGSGWTKLSDDDRSSLSANFQGGFSRGDEEIQIWAGDEVDDGVWHWDFRGNTSEPYSVEHHFSDGQIFKVFIETSENVEELVIDYVRRRLLGSGPDQ